MRTTARLQSWYAPKRSPQQTPCHGCEDEQAACIHERSSSVSATISKTQAMFAMSLRQTPPRACHAAVNSLRVRTPTFRNMLAAWLSTVRRET